MNTLTVIGAGPGDRSMMLPAAAKKIEEADIVIADRRYVSVIAHKDVRPMGKISEMTAVLDCLCQNHKVAVVVSGDPLMYSLYKTIRKQLPDIEIEVIPGIGSIQLFAVRLGETLEDAVFLSAHGRNLSEGRLALMADKHEKVFILCDKIHGPAWIARVLCGCGLEYVDMWAAENLSYENEKIVSGRPEDFISLEFESLCVVCLKNRQAVPEKILRAPALLSDEDFIRGKTPMTKEEIRWIILGKLKLTKDAVVWDIGAGTGAVSVECARQCPFGQVYAVEKDEKALELIEKNKKKFHAYNLKIVPGQAPESIRTLPVPTHVFIGGSGRAIEAIIDEVIGAGPGITVMAACVTVETTAQAAVCFKKLEDVQMIQAGICRSRPLGGYHIWDPHNPITLMVGRTV